MIIYENGFKTVGNSDNFKTIENKLNFTLLDTFFNFRESDQSLYNYFNKNDDNISHDNYEYKYIYKDYFKSKLNELFLD